VIFTTVQKFMPVAGEEHMPVLTARRNVIVIADEAHRGQYGFDARLIAAGGLNEDEANDLLIEVCKHNGLWFENHRLC
jgi:type I restriction enzyme R subunit